MNTEDKTAFDEATMRKLTAVPYVIAADNPDDALCKGAAMLANWGDEIAPRGAKTLEMDAPVLTVYADPTHRVIFNPERNANPFFHLMEALWILAGRQDVRWLAKFNKRMANYSDNGITFHAPYGRRIKNQIDSVVHMLQTAPDTRRAVLQIWDYRRDLNHNGLDLPCNDLIFLKVRDGRLQMRVCCRSNDMLWGAYGANVVQFSVLQEYLAARIGVGIGPYTQISDSFHVYTEGAGGATWQAVSDAQRHGGASRFPDRYSPFMEDRERVAPTPLVKQDTIAASVDSLDHDIEDMFYTFDHANTGSVPAAGGILRELIHTPYRTDFFNYCVVPMLIAWRAHKKGNTDWAFHYLNNHAAELDLTHPLDWIQAGAEWMQRANTRKDAE